MASERGGVGRMPNEASVLRSCARRCDECGNRCRSPFGGRGPNTMLMKPLDLVAPLLSPQTWSAHPPTPPY